MENYSKLLCVILVMYCMIGISTSSCPLIETNELEPLINDAVVSQGGEGIISVDVSEMNINCQAVGNLKDTYNYLTITARYQRSDNTIQVGQIFLDCEMSDWVYTVLNLISDTNEQNALLTANTNTNCFMCSDTCDECDSACDQGLGFCTDSTNTSCCSFYDNDVCVSQCGTNKHSNESFDCVCNQFYNGADCTNCILQQSDCQNGGSVNLATCSCDCTTGYMAQTCNEDINECQTDDPCINSISCTNTNGSYVCDCMSGFTGMNCETNINDCMSDSCLHNSTCIDDVNNFTCVCTDGYEGLTCETNIDDCSPNPCMNGGTCTDDIDFYTCVCTDQYTGKDCDEDVNECENDPCNNGTCTNNNGGFVCTCDHGWTGFTCTMNIDDCSPNPCKNGGTCTDDIGDYTCECTDQYTGKNCSEDVNECEDDEPCLNGGTCGNFDGGFDCRCQGRWAGALCSTCVIDDCKVADCDGRDFECLECNEGYKPSPDGDECIPCTIPSCTICSTSEVCSSCEEGLVTDRDGSACASPIPRTSEELSVGIIFGIIIVLGVLIAIVITVIVVVAVVSLRIRAKKPIQHATKDPGDSRDPIVLTKISHL